MTDLIKPDLSKDTTGPFVTRDGRKAVYVPTPKPLTATYPYAFDIEGEPELEPVQADGSWYSGNGKSRLDIFLAPKEPRTVFVNVWPDGLSHYYSDRATADRFAQDRRALLQLQVDDQGIPIDGSVVKRVEL